MANFVSDLLNILTGMQGETVARKPGISYGRHAMSRIGRTPVQFTNEPILGGKLAGEFNPNTNNIDIFVGEGRSPRQIGRTLAHEDMHSVFEREGQPDRTHDILANPQKPDESLSDLDDIQRLIELFKLLD